MRRPCPHALRASARTGHRLRLPSVGCAPPGVRASRHPWAHRQRHTQRSESRCWDIPISWSRSKRSRSSTPPPRPGPTASFWIATRPGVTVQHEAGQVAARSWTTVAGPCVATKRTKGRVWIVTQWPMSTRSGSWTTGVRRCAPCATTSASRRSVSTLGRPVRRSSDHQRARRGRAGFQRGAVSRAPRARILRGRR